MRKQPLELRRLAGAASSGRAAGGRSGDSRARSSAPRAGDHGRDLLHGRARPERNPAGAAGRCLECPRQRARDSDLPHALPPRPFGRPPRHALDIAYAGLTDSLGIVVYPISTTDDPGRIGEVAQAQQAVRALAGGKPTFQWIEATRPADDSGATPTPAEIEAQAWLAVVNGARALGWWTYGSSPFSVNAANREALREISSAIDTFTPAIEAPAAPVTSPTPASTSMPPAGTAPSLCSPSTPIRPNPSRSVYEILTLPRLDRRPVQIWNTGRALAGSAHTFADILPPLAWRIYLVPPQ